MYISAQKRKENIAEYILYMWQIEDLIRAYKFDIDQIRQNIISKFGLETEKEKELVQWYENLIEMMRMENVQQIGHLQVNKNVLIDLLDMHKQLLFSQEYPDYSSAYYKALPFITELKTKQTDTEIDDIETAFSFLYGILMLKLQQKEISEGTEKAKESISKFIVQLASKYKLYKAGQLKLDSE